MTGVDHNNDQEIVQTLYDELISSCIVVCKTDVELDMIRKAYYLAKEAHQGVKRKSGEPYIIHPLSVAKIVVSEIGLGYKSVVTALLHDVVEDTDYTVEDIEHHFGGKIASMVDGLTKLSDVVASEMASDEVSAQAENFKKMLLTLSDDIRVIIIKIADRLHNMRTLGSMAQHKQMKIASETIYLFAPLAHRLGLYNIKTEFENLSLKYRFPDEYNQIEEKLKNTEHDREKFIEQFNTPIITKLNDNEISFKINGRVKSVYSIWKKMKRKQVSFEEIYDLFAIRIVFTSKVNVSEKSQCWNIFALITDIYRPKSDRIRDWITAPKENGYEALHCTVMGLNGLWAEVQIRSERMDNIAERGFAAHWRYKEDISSVKKEYELDMWLGQLREAINNPAESAIEFLDNFQLNLQISEIVVFTPKGEPKTLPKGATVLDFAYAIHSKVGNKAIGAKINHRLTTIYTEIHSGDQIEILTSSNAKPQFEWLQHVITAKAKTKIKSYLHKDKSRLIKEGQELFERQMKELKVQITPRVFQKLLPAYQCINKDQFYILVKSNNLQTTDIDKHLRYNLASKLVKQWTLQLASLGRITSKKNSPDNNNNFIIADCCRPIPGDTIIGFKNSKGVVTVHKKNCPIAIKQSSQNGNDIVEPKWSSEKIMSYLAVLELRGLDRTGLMLDVTRVITEELAINIRSVTFHSYDGIFDGKISLYVKNNADLRTIIHKVGTVKGVDKIHRIENISN